MRPRSALVPNRTVAPGPKSGKRQLGAALAGSRKGCQVHNGKMPVTFKWPTEEYGPAPIERNEYGQPDGVPALKRLVEIVEQRRDEFRKLDAAVSAHPEVRRKREEEQRVAEAEQLRSLEQQKLKSQVSQIEI